MSSGINSIYSQDNINSPKPFNDGVYEFDRFRLDGSHLMLYENFSPVALAPKVVETLLALVERRGEVVSKDELMNRLWADSFVEESNLTQNIYLLRKTLGKAADGRDLIETFRRRGYRFNGRIEKNSADLIEANAAGEQNAAEQIARHRADGERENAYNSLAVLPLTNESAEDAIEYLCDGITESIINRLSQISQLRVLARNTAFSYKNQTVAPQEIGRKLGVSAILTGRVLQLGERLIVRAELVETGSGWQVWGEQYDRQSSDILELQETIAREISENLRVKLTGEEKRRLTKRYTESSEAYHFYIKGRYHLNKRLTPAIERAAEFFQKAIDVDPAYAPAYVGLADCYPLLSLYGALTPREAYPKAEAAALKALEFDGQSAKAYNALGVVKLFYEWDWAGAEAAFRRAIELNPGYPDARQRMGMFLTAMGNFDEAAAELERATELDPLSLITKTIGGYPFYYGRRYEQAVECFQDVIALDKNYSMAHFRLGLTFAQQGKYENAIAELEQSVVISNDRDSIAALGYVQGLAGNYAAAEAALTELDEREKTGFVTSYNRVLVNLGLGDYDQALEWLERAFNERSYWLIYLKVDPALDPLRGNRRFHDLEDRIFNAEASRNTASLTVQESLRNAEINQPERFFSHAGKKQKSYFLAGAGILLVFLAVIFALRQFDRRGKIESAQIIQPQNISLKRLTPDIHTYNPAISPDGKYVAYALIENDRAGLWLKEVATGVATQVLPPTAEGYKGLQFSPDNEWIYYLSSRRNAPNQIIARVPAFGGAPQEIAQNVISPPAVSPDGEQIAFVRGQSLTIADATGGNERVVAERDGATRAFVAWDSQMSWSPDGKRIAVCQERTENNSRLAELIEISVRDGSEQTIKTPGWSEIDDAAWLPDGKGLLVTVKESPTAAYQIWHLPYPNGEPRRITNDLSGYEWLSVSADGKKIVAQQMLGNRNIWLLAGGQTKPLTSGGAADNGNFGLAFTPDGKIVYTSPRSGNVDLWMMDEDGGGQKQLTHNAGTYNGKPAVTPDGRFIVFTSNRSGSNKLWRMETSGANAARLTVEENEERHPNISPDGAWVFYARVEGKTSAIWKVPIEGGAPVRVSASAAHAWLPVVSPDGELIAYQVYEDGAANPWKTRVMSVAGGESLESLELPHTRALSWTSDSKSLIYTNTYSLNLLQQPLRGEARQITDFNSERIFNFAVAADGRRIVVSRGNHSTETVLISGFSSE